jgi:hypothetical protein
MLLDKSSMEGPPIDSTSSFTGRGDEPVLFVPSGELHPASYIP